MCDGQTDGPRSAVVSCNSRSDVSGCRLHCRYHAEPQPRVEWLFNGSQLYASDHVTLSGSGDQSALSIDHVTLLDTGEYVCSASNALGQATTKTFLRVRSTSLIMTYLVFLSLDTKL